MNTSEMGVSLVKNRIKMIPERRLAIDILAEFENLLDYHSISIPDEGRQGSDCEARLYGRTYYDLEDKITELIHAFIEKEGRLET